MVNKKALGEKPKAAGDMPTTPKRKAKREDTSAPERDPRSLGPRKLPDNVVKKRRVIFLNDFYYDAIKARAKVESKRRGERVAASEIIREAIVEYLGL